jgi:hypothetical protein
MELSRETLVAIAAGVVVLVVPPFLVPYPPFHDLLAMVGLQSYPPRLSYGPTHYYVFQLTYILHHIISRLCVDIGIGTHGQSRLYYLIHALGYFAVTVGLLNRFVRQVRVRAVAILLGAMAFTDGMFVIGGPFPFSLVGVLLMISLLLISEARETGRPPSRFALVALAFLAMMCHPFAAPFLLLLYGVNFVLSPPQRVTSAVVFVLVAAYAVLIGRESPESVSSAQLWQLFDPNLPHVWHNFAEALGWDSNWIRLLMGDPVPLVSAYVNTIAAIKLLGGLLGVVFFRRLWRNESLRLLLVLNLAFLAMFATGVDVTYNWIIAQWPWRIWSITNPLLYSFGVIAAVEIAGGLKWPKMPEIRWNWAYPVLGVLAVVLLAAQSQLFAKGRMVESARRDLRATVIQSGAHDALVTWSGANNIEPYFLRSVPFLMFSDPDLIARNLLFATDWQTMGRHNTHIPELTFASDRPRLNMEFLPSNGAIHAEIHGKDMQRHFPLKVRFGDRIPRTGAGEPLLTTGQAGDANFVFVLAPAPAVVMFYLDAWGFPWAASPPVVIDPAREYNVDIWLGSKGIKVQVDGATVWERSTPVRSLENPQIGQNPVGGTTALPQFSGMVKRADEKR